MIAASTLHRVAELATDAYDREHVRPYVRSRPEAFRIIMPDVPIHVRRPDLRPTVDIVEQCDFMRRVLQQGEAGFSPAPLRAVIAAADAVLLEGTA